MLRLDCISLAKLDVEHGIDIKIHRYTASHLYFNAAVCRMANVIDNNMSIAFVTWNMVCLEIVSALKQNHL